MIDPPNKKLNNPAAALNAPKNRQPINTTIVKGKDARGTYTDTNINQADDLYEGRSAGVAGSRPTNAWWNSLSAGQKAAHNARERAKLGLQSPSITVPGTSSTSRVYDLAKAPAVSSGRHWTAEGTGMTFGGHTNRGTTIDPKVIASGYAKNKVDVQFPASKNNTYEARAFTERENTLWNKGKLRNSDNPIGRDTIGRGAKQDKMIALLNQSKVNMLPNAKSSIVSKEKGGVIVNGKALKPKPEVMAKGAKVVFKSDADAGCGCGGGKMQKGGELPSKPVGGASNTSPRVSADFSRDKSAKKFVLKTTPTPRPIENSRKGKQNTSSPYYNNIKPNEAMKTSASKSGMPKAPRVYAKGGGISDIDEESPI